MAKKKARPKDDIGMAYYVEGPRGMSRAKVYRAMLEAIRNGTGELPEGVSVTWKWRNSKKQPMREASFASAIRKSRAGFLALMRKRILRDASAVPGFVAPREPRQATAREMEAIEEEEELTEERRERKGQRKGEATRARETREKAKRSAAARKGWATRRAAAAAKKRKTAKKKRTAKKGKRK